MSSSCKGVIVTEIKDLLLVATLLEGAFTRLTRDCLALDKADAEASGRVVSTLALLQSYNVVFSLSPSMGMLSVIIKLRGVERTLTVFMHCDCDNVNLGESSISMSVGDFGNSELLVKTALTALSVLGPAFYKRTSLDDEAAHPMDAPAQTFNELLARSFLSGYVFERLADEHLADKGYLQDLGMFTKVFGLAKQEYRELSSNKDHSARWDALRAKVSEDGCGSSALPFWPQKIADLGPAASK